MSEGPIYSSAMSPLLRPVQMLLLMFAGWVNRHQLDVIEYLQEENRVLKERMVGGAFVSPMPNAVDSPEKRKHSGARC
jgi:hypothetical protein